MIHKAIWLLLQICVTVCEVLWHLCSRLQLTIRSYDQRREEKNKEKYFLKSCCSKLNKLPTHLSIIIGPEESDVEDELILRLINYALWMRIDFISLYDARLDPRCCDLQSLKLPTDVRVKQLGKQHLLWILDSSCNEIISAGKENENGYKNGLKSDSSIQIFEVQSFQGQALIADVCRNLFKQRQSYELKEMLKNRVLLSQYLDEELSIGVWKCKDPELCIIFSKYMCTFGMLPWQTRFTEFYLHQKANVFDARKFAKILFQYAGCEQRWGK